MSRFLSRKSWQVSMLIVFAVLVFGTVQPGLAAGPDGAPPEQDQPAGAYRSLALPFNSGEVGLAGTLALPEAGEGPFPAVVMIHGSAPETRQIFWETGDAQAFLQAGIAVFIYDKRGTGESGGDWRSASLQELAADAVAAVDLVRSRPEIKADAVGVFGVSQGGWLAPLAAADAPQIAFLVDVTGAALPLANQEMWRVGNELRQRGFSEQALDSTMKVMHLLFSARPLLQSGKLPLGGMYIWFAALDPYLDPDEIWPQVSQPAYVAYGTVDALVPTGDSVAVLQDVFAVSRPDSRLVVYPGAGHGVRLPDGEWAPGHIDRMTDWVLAVTEGRQPAPAPQLPQADRADQRWYGRGAAAAAGLASFPLQVGLIVFFGLVFGLGLLAALNPRVELALPGLGSLPRLALLLGSVVNLALLAGLLKVIAFLAFADPDGAGPQVPYAGLLAALAGVSVLLAIGLAFFALRGGASPEWPRGVQAVYALAAIAAAGYLPFLLYWNLLGPPL